MPWRSAIRNFSRASSSTVCAATAWPASITPGRACRNSWPTWTGSPRGWRGHRPARSSARSSMRPRAPSPTAARGILRRSWPIPAVPRRSCWTGPPRSRWPSSPAACAPRPPPRCAPVPRCCSTPTAWWNVGGSGWSWASARPRTSCSRMLTARPMSWPTGCWWPWRPPAGPATTSWSSPTGSRPPRCG